MTGGESGPQFGCELEVSVRSSTGQPVRAGLTLIGTGLFSRTGETDNTGQATFLSLPEDNYRLIVRLADGKQTEEAVSTRDGKCVQLETVRLGGADELSSSPVVFAGDLKAPNKAKRIYEQGIAKLRRQQWREAQRLLEKSIRIYPEFSAAYNALGIAASENEEFEVANAAFREAIRIRKNYSEAYLNLARFLIRRERFKESALLLNELISFDKENRAAITLLVECLFALQKFDEVIDLVHEIHLKHVAHDFSVHRFTFEIYQQRGMRRESEAENVVIAAESHINP
jgi:tetratricopeptide (TPR) repeat protein